MARHCKRDLYLVPVDIQDIRKQKRARIENRRPSCQPGLVIVLGALETQHGKRQVALQQIGRPTFPFQQQIVDLRNRFPIAQTA